MSNFENARSLETQGARRGTAPSAAASPADRKRVAPLTVLLAVVFLVFCGILVFVYVATKRANPVMLDQQGKPLDSGSGAATSGAH
jgi:predicted secreted protein